MVRQSGQAVRGRIEREIVKEGNRTVIALDFSKIGIVDYSCADEIVAKLVSRLLGGEYGEKYILLTGINESQKENIEVALERKGLAMMVKTKDNKNILLGNINNYLKQTLDIIIEKDKITAKELSGIMKLEANTSGTRLLNLHKKHLVRRTEEIVRGGRVWVYECV
jgi:hypothetical protein